MDSHQGGKLEPNLNARLAVQAEELAADAEIAKLKAELKALRGDGLPPADYGTTQV